MSNCLECKKTLPPRIEGKRERKFCDNKGACKQRYWAKQNKKKPKTVKLSIEEYNALLAKVAENNLPERNEIPKQITKRVYPLTEKEMIPRLPGENSIDYRIRCAELENKK